MGGPGHHGPGGFVGGGPVFAPWLGALAVGAVAGAAIAPYSGGDRGRPGMVVWQEGGQEMSAKVNMLTVRERGAGGRGRGEGGKGEGEYGMCHVVFLCFFFSANSQPSIYVQPVKKCVCVFFFFYSLKFLWSCGFFVCRYVYLCGVF